MSLVFTVCLCLCPSVHIVLCVCVTVQDKWGSVAERVCVDGAVLVCLPGAVWCDGQVTDGWTVAVRPPRHHLQAEQKRGC